MTNLIGDSLMYALWEQIVLEKENANAYLEISAFLKNKGLNSFSKKFEEQYREENEHAEMIVNFMTDLSCPVRIQDIKSLSTPPVLLSSIALFYLEREIATTTSLRELLVLASTEDCPVGVEFIRKMILLQQKEYAEATDFYDKMQIVGDDWKTALLLDAAWGE